MTAPTAEGSLYEVDLRLRPSGQKGPVATQLSSFVHYQTQDAWTWEHVFDATPSGLLRHGSRFLRRSS